MKEIYQNCSTILFYCNQSHTTIFSIDFKLNFKNLEGTVL
jgi:hypothetical protein